MTELSQSTRDDLPTTKQLLKASGIATAVAAVLLITAVLPAEYGIDPTGIGERLGLAVMGKAGKPPAVEARVCGHYASQMKAAAIETNAAKRDASLS